MAAKVSYVEGNMVITTDGPVEIVIKQAAAAMPAAPVPPIAPPPVVAVPAPSVPVPEPGRVFISPARVENMVAHGTEYESTPTWVKAGGVCALHFDLSSGKISYGSVVMVEFDRAIKIPLDVAAAAVKENFKDYRAWVKPLGGERKNNIVFNQPYAGWYFLFVENVPIETRWQMKPPPTDGKFRHEKFEFTYPSRLAAADGRVRRWLDGILICDAKQVQFEAPSAYHVGLQDWHCIQVHCPNWNPPDDSFMKVKNIAYRVTP